MSKVLMIQGTMSNAGKSLIVAGLCRIFYRKGYKTVPFKAQNMALNSFITKDGLEMGRAQVVQAEACCRTPSILMNPLLLKPVSQMGSQVIVKGKVIGTYQAEEFYKMKTDLVRPVMDSYNELSSQNDLVIIEGAGSPAEINLRQYDLVNMGMALRATSPVLLVGDIDRGGVFAQLYGTVSLVSENEKALIKGLIINKFRGDVNLLSSGLRQIEKLTGVPVLGTVPYVHLDIDDEDSQSDRFDSSWDASKIDIVVIHLRYLSNYSDFTSLGAQKEVNIRYVENPKELGSPDLIIIPGTKSTISDLLILRENGMEAKLKAVVTTGIPIIGICGGYQMLGKTLSDPDGIEGEKGRKVRGMDLLPVSTVFEKEKRTVQINTITNKFSGFFDFLSQKEVNGYEIHMGKSHMEGEGVTTVGNDGCCSNNVFGTYIHGFFDSSEILSAIIINLCQKKGIDCSEKVFDYYKYKMNQYDKLADVLEQSLDIDKIEKIIEMGI